MVKKILIFLIIFASSTNKVSATNYFVSPSGNDANVGSSESAPWRTIRKATSTVVPGDSVYVHNGTYAETVVISKSGTSAGRITFSASPNENPIIDGSGMTSIATDGLVQINDNVNYITFSGFTVKRSPKMGIANRGSNNIVNSNKILLSYDSAIWHRFGTNTVFRNNEVYYNVRMFTVSASENGIVCNGSASWWPATLNSQNSTGALWEGNYVHNNCGEGIVAHTGDKIIGNKFRDNWSINIYIDNGTGVLIDRNFVYDTDTVFSVWPGNGRNIPIGIALADEQTPCNTFDNTISNNIIVNARFGVSFYPYTSCSGVINTKIINNSFINSWEYGIRITGSAAANSKSIIANNIFSTNRGKSLIIDNLKDFKIQNNLWYSGNTNSAAQFQIGSAVTDLAGFNAAFPTQISGNIWADPQYSSSLPTDLSQLTPSVFSLKNTSVAIDKGAGSVVVAADFIGKSRPQGAAIDLGAFEYGGTGAAVPPPSATPLNAVASSPTPTPKPWTTLTTDYANWLSYYLQSVRGFAKGDFNENGKVDGIDYMLWVNNYGK